jgi:hypothetical protein
MGTLYDDDVIAWADQQVALLRAGRWELLDIDNIAEEIKDVGKSERRELESRLAVLMSHLLKWQLQARLRGPSWINTMREQRKSIQHRLQKSPNLVPLLSDEDCLAEVYRRAQIETYASTHLKHLPEDRPWTMEQVMAPDFLPG